MNSTGIYPDLKPGNAFWIALDGEGGVLGFSVSGAARHTKEVSDLGMPLLSVNSVEPGSQDTPENKQVTHE